MFNGMIDFNEGERGIIKMYDIPCIGRGSCLVLRYKNKGGYSQEPHNEKRRFAAP